MKEKFLTGYFDPGEDFGWAVACGTVLLAAGTDKMSHAADDLALWLQGRPCVFNDRNFLRNGADAKLLKLPLGRIVMEDWRLYPEKLRFLKWDRCRTARVIGDVEGQCRRASIPVVLQPASIKKTAVAAGAEEYYYHPLRENRHQNDAIQHFVFYSNTELMGIEDAYKRFNIPNNVQEGGDER